MGDQGWVIKDLVNPGLDGLVRSKVVDRPHEAVDLRGRGQFDGILSLRETQPVGH